MLLPDTKSGTNGTARPARTNGRCGAIHSANFCRDCSNFQHPETIRGGAGILPASRPPGRLSYHRTVPAVSESHQKCDVLVATSQNSMSSLLSFSLHMYAQQADPTVRLLRR